MILWLCVFGACIVFYRSTRHLKNLENFIALLETRIGHDEAIPQIGTSAEGANVAEALAAALMVCRRRGLSRQEELLLLWQESHSGYFDEKARHQMLGLYLQRIMFITSLCLVCRFLWGAFLIDFSGICLELICVWFVLLGYFVLRQLLYKKKAINLCHTTVQTQLISAFILDIFSFSPEVAWAAFRRCQKMKRDEIRQGVDFRQQRMQVLLHDLRICRFFSRDMKAAETFFPMCELLTGGMILLCTFLAWPMAD